MRHIIITLLIINIGVELPVRSILRPGITNTIYMDVVTDIIFLLDILINFIEPNV